MQQKYSNQLSDIAQIVFDAMRLNHKHGITKDNEHTARTIGISNYTTQIFGNSCSSPIVEANVKLTLDGKAHSTHVIMQAWQPARTTPAYNGDECHAVKGNSSGYLNKLQNGDFDDIVSELSYLAVYLADGIIKGSPISSESGIKATVLHALTLKPIGVEIDDLKITTIVKSKKSTDTIDFSWADIKHLIFGVKTRHDNTTAKLPMRKSHTSPRAANMEF
jgi:hypothetical protein